MTPSDVHSAGAAALDAVRAATDQTSLEQVRADYLGRGDGRLAVFRRGLGAIADPAARRQAGRPSMP